MRIEHLLCQGKKKIATGVSLNYGNIINLFPGLVPHVILCPNIFLSSNVLRIYFVCRLVILSILFESHLPRTCCRYSDFANGYGVCTSIQVGSDFALKIVDTTRILIKFLFHFFQWIRQNLKKIKSPKKLNFHILPV